MACQRSGWLSLVAAGMTVTLSAQTPKPTFEVASVKPQSASIRLGDLANLAARQMGTPVLDQTGLTGKWNFDLTFASNLGPTDVNPTLAPFPVALEEQLGLKLEPGRGPVDVLAIDSVQQPTDN